MNSTHHELNFKQKFNMKMLTCRTNRWLENNSNTQKQLSRSKNNQCSFVENDHVLLTSKTTIHYFPAITIFGIFKLF